jgi:hypothetical protein
MWSWCFVQSPSATIGVFGKAFGLVACVALAAQQPLPFEEAREPAARNQIDTLLFAALSRQGIRPARPCSDAVFVRRVHLDTIGTLPTAGEAREFLADPGPDKRSRLIDRLLAREEFADYWALKWCDLLRVKSEFPINLWPNAAQAYQRWIRASLAQRVPCDLFARELLTASGSNFRVPQVNFYRALPSREPEAIARAVALTFLATRAEQWPAARLEGLAGFFAQVAYKPTAEWKEEIVYFDADRPRRATVFPDGTEAVVPAGKDPRAVFADWLLRPRNPWFARGLANRMWSWLLGRGLVHEPDDVRPDNPPCEPALLDHLARELVAVGYDQRRFFRLILESQAYQLSSLPRHEGTGALASFASYPLRRLEAEVLIDALDQVCGTTETYTSAIPEPYTVLPGTLRSIALPDGSITSSFLEMFGRPARDTGLEAERNEKCSAAQRLHLLNSGHVQRKIEQGPGLRALFDARRGPAEKLTELYLRILSRSPTPAELQAVQAHLEAGNATGASGRREAAIDVAWALVNSAEFLYRH